MSSTERLPSTKFNASYDTANRTMKAGELVLVDHSAEVNYYVCDLARTVPVSGQFDPDQRLAYETYLAAYDAGLAAIRPGVPYLRAGEVAAETMRSRIAQLPEWLRKAAESFGSAQVAAGQAISSA